MPITSVREAMHEKKRKGWTRAQAVAIGLKGEREKKKRGKGRKMKKRHGKRTKKMRY